MRACGAKTCPRKRGTWHTGSSYESLIRKRGAMIRRSAPTCLALILVALVSSPARPAEVLPREEVDKLVRPLVDDGWAPAIVVGLVSERGTQVCGYGKIDDGPKAEAPGGDTVFEIGSVTK